MGGHKNAPVDPFLYVLRLAKVTDTVDDEPDEGAPYIYEASIYSGHWDDVPAVRTALASAIDVWSPVALAVDDWIAVIRIGEHWEMFGGAGSSGGGLPDYPAVESVLVYDPEAETPLYWAQTGVFQCPT